MTGVNNDRHLSWPNLLEYLEAGAPAVVRIDGTPPLALIIEPVEQRIAVRGPWPESGEVPDLAPYRHLDTGVGTGPSGDWVEFAVSGRLILQEAYPVLLAVADRVQLHGDGMGAAIARVLDSFRELLSALGRLSDNQEVGLYGELLVLDHLIDSVGERTAVGSWRGPTWEEHDFGLDDFDIEVKTTLSEDRSHHISSLTQLEPSPDRSLWLVSVQLTTGGVGGNTLPEQIRRIASRLLSPELPGLFASTLAALGWDAAHGHLYRRRFALRGHVLTFRITPEFPAITEHRLREAGLPVERIAHVSYVLKIVGLPHDRPPTELQGLIVP